MKYDRMEIISILLKLQKIVSSSDDAKFVEHCFKFLHNGRKLNQREVTKVYALELKMEDPEYNQLCQIIKKLEKDLVKKPKTIKIEVPFETKVPVYIDRPVEIEVEKIVKVGITKDEIKQFLFTDEGSELMDDVINEKEMLSMIEWNPVTGTSNGTKVGTAPLKYNGRKLKDAMKAFRKFDKFLMTEYIDRIKQMIRIIKVDGKFKVVSDFTSKELVDSEFTCEKKAQSRLRKAWTYNFTGDFSKPTRKLQEIEQFTLEFVNHKFRYLTKI